MIHIVQNDPAVPAGRIPGIIAECGLKYRLWYAWMDDFNGLPPDAKALIVLGGIMGADDLDAYPYLDKVYSSISKAVENEIPFLGICLGGQLLARVSGGRLMKNIYGEKGCMSVDLTREGAKDVIFSGFPPIWPVFQWHNDAFVPPLNSAVLCSSSICSFQAFRVGKRAYGIQFHPEVTPLMAYSWAEVSDSGSERLSDFRSYYSEYRIWARRFLYNFVKRVVLE